VVSEQPVRRFSVYLVRLDPAIGVEMRKLRPCVVISPEVMHHFVRTVIIAPLTSGATEYPARVPSIFAGRPGEVALDQMRAVDRSRLLKLVGHLDGTTGTAVAKALVELFR